MTFRFFAFVSGLAIAGMGFMLGAGAQDSIVSFAGWCFFAAGVLTVVGTFVDKEIND